MHAHTSLVARSGDRVAEDVASAFMIVNGRVVRERRTTAPPVERPRLTGATGDESWSYTKDGATRSSDIWRDET